MFILSFERLISRLVPRDQRESRGNKDDVSATPGNIGDWLHGAVAITIAAWRSRVLGTPKDHSERSTIHGLFSEAISLPS